MKKLFRNKKALSPVIATVILISVTIVVAVSVAYWMGSIAGGYTSFEQIELPTTYARWDAALFTSAGGWNITIELKNTGSADATLTNVFVNSKPLKDLTINKCSLTADGTSVVLSTMLKSDNSSISITKGNSVTLNLCLKRDTGEGFTAGTTVSIKLHTAGGKDYPTSIRLP